MPNLFMRSANSNPKLKKLVTIVFLFLFLVLACQFFISSILIVRPEQEITHWETSKMPIDSAQAYTIGSRLERAERLSFLPFQLKDTSKINELYSRLYLALSLIENPKSNLELAELHAIKLTQAAPSNYLGWTLLAQSKIYKDNYTWEDQSALTKALTLAPFERKNQIRLLPLVIENWLLLSNKNQELTLELIGSALNDPSTDHIAAGYMREFDNIIPFNPLIDNSPLSGRIRRMLKQ